MQRLGDDLVQVAVADPTNLQTQDELRLALGMNCRLAVADADALASTIDRTYRLTLSVTDAPPEELFLDDAAAAESALDMVNTLIGRAVNQGSSDLHIDPQARDVLVRFRVDGVMRDDAPIDKRSQNALAARIKVMAQLDIAEKRMPQDGSFVVYIGGAPVDVRAAILPTKHGEQIVLRLLQREAKMELPSLGMSAEMESIFMGAISQPYGAVLTCGPTGSGKTTTLYAALDRLNDGMRSIATIEDPVEYQLPGVMQTEVHARIGLTFERGSAHDPARRPRRDPRRRDPRRRDGEDRDPGGDDGPSRADDTAHERCGRRDRAPARARGRSRPPLRLDQLHRLAAPRPAHLPALPPARTSRHRSRCSR